MFPEDDQALSNLLWSLGRFGSEEFFFISGWDGYEDQRIQQFLQDHPPEEIPD
jgi:hypothetical protein